MSEQLPLGPEMFWVLQDNILLASPETSDIVRKTLGLQTDFDCDAVISCSEGFIIHSQTIIRKRMKQVISDMFWVSTHGVSFLATLRVKFWGDSVTGTSGELMSLS